MQRQLAFKLSTTVETSRKKNLFFVFLFLLLHFHFLFLFLIFNIFNSVSPLSTHTQIAWVFSVAKRSGKSWHVPNRFLLFRLLCVCQVLAALETAAAELEHIQQFQSSFFFFFVYKIGKKGSHFCFMTLFGCVQHSRLFFFFLPLSLFHAGQMFASFGLFFFLLWRCFQISAPLVNVRWSCVRDRRNCIQMRGAKMLDAGPLYSFRLRH